MEEDIEILEDYIYNKKETMKELQQAIEHLIKEYKELKEENGELKQCLEVTSKALGNVAYDQISIAIVDLMIPKSLVKEKIEELNELIVEAQKELGSDSKEFKIYVYQKDILQELLEKRK